MGEQMDATLFMTKFALEALGIKGFSPVLSKSARWKRWFVNLSTKTCEYCMDENGKIFDINSTPQIEPPVHERCRCYIGFMLSISAGTATVDKMNGADYFIKFYKNLPKNYVDKEYAKSMGWRNNKGNLRIVLPGAAMGGDIYKNKEGKLPNAPGRVWHEADINYAGGYRNTQRVLYSNDGLIFVTYDHYLTFYEIN